MKKIIFTSFLFLLHLHSNAQFNFSVGKTFYALKAPGFQTFFRTYDSAFVADIKTPFKSDFPTATGWSIKGGYVINKHDDGGVGFFYNSVTGVNVLKTKNEAVFLNDESRKTELHILDWNTDVALGVGGDNFHIAIIGSFLGHFNKLFCSYVYHDGSESFGPEKTLNGIFTANRLMAGYGAEVGVGIKYVQLVFKMQKIYKPFNKDGSTYLSFYSDLAGYKADAGSNGASSYPTEFIPANYGQFLADQLTSEINNNIIYISDRGWQYGLSLMFIIPGKD